MSRDLLRRLTHGGVRSDTSPSEAKYILVTNFVALVGISVSFVYLLVNLRFQSATTLQLGPPLLSASGYGVPLLLNRNRRYWAATTSMCIATIALQLTFVFTFGYVSGNHFYLLPLLGGLPLVYPPRHRRTAAVLVLVTLALFVTIVLRGEAMPPRVAVASETSAAYHALALCTAAVLLVFISYYSHQSTVAAEERVEKRSRDLAKALGELRAAQARIIESEHQVMLGRLVAGLLHEINTPLGSIRSAAGTITAAVEHWRRVVAERALPHEPDATTSTAVDVSLELCRSLQGSTSRIAGVVEGLRQFVGLDEAERKLVDVRHGIDGAAALLGDALSDRIRLVREYTEKIPRVMGSPAKLNRVFLRLLQNSIDAIEGRGEIRVSVREREGAVEVELSDDGRGIPPRMMAEIFEVGLTEKAGRVGLRLGLPISKRNVEETGGRLTLESVVGRGTTVRVTLPAAGRAGD